MAGIKRKEVPPSKTKDGKTSKKLKTNGSKVSKAVAPPKDLEAEAETDSEPILESDTTDHSGEDYGVSWPSDNEKLSALDSNVKDIEIDHVHPSRKENGAGNTESSREAHAKRKALAQERKAAKPNADSIARSKKIWERLRRQSHVPLQERKNLVAELFEIITGRVKEFVFRHDSGRVIQTALKYANLEQRKMIVKELRGDYRQLAESKYAKFMIDKILVHGDDEIRDLVIPEFYGHVRRMINHPEAAWVLDDVYRKAATPKQKARLLREWYGAEFAIFKPGKQETSSAGLKMVLTEHPEKRSTVLHYLHDMINQLVQKKITGFTMLHDAMLQYYLNVVPGSEEATEFVELIKGDEEGDLLKSLAFTKSGAHLVCLVLAHSNAKDRKLLLRTYKGTMQMLAFNTYGHQVILAAYDLIDDTVLTAKSIFPELIIKESSSTSDVQNADILNYITDLNARVPILYLFVPKPASVLPSEDLALLQEIHTIRITTSKKDPDLRRKELVKAFSPVLLSIIETRGPDLLQNSFGCQFISEVLLGADGDKTAALSAVASLIDDQNVETAALLETPHTSRMLKALVQGGRFNQNTKTIDAAESPLHFSDMLYDKIHNDIVDWATGVNAFVVVGLLESVDFGKQEELRETLKQQREKLQSAATDEEGIKKEENKEKQKTREAGRKGTKLLLKMLDE